MNLIKWIIVVSLLSAASFAMQSNGSDNINDSINKLLSQHPDVYKFNGKEFDGEAGAPRRIEQLKTNKEECIKEYIIDQLTLRINELTKDNCFPGRLKILGYEYDTGLNLINYSTIKGFLKLAVPFISLHLFPVKSYIGEYAAYNTANAAGNMAVDRLFSAEGYEEKISELQIHIKTINEALKNDPMNKFEVRLMEKWHEFSDSEKDRLIRCLLDLRIDKGKNVANLQAVIETMLKKPKNLKSLVPENSIANTDESKKIDELINKVQSWKDLPDDKKKSLGYTLKSLPAKNDKEVNALKSLLNKYPEITQKDEDHFKEELSSFQSKAESSKKLINGLKEKLEDWTNLSDNMKKDLEKTLTSLHVKNDKDVDALNILLEKLKKHPEIKIEDEDKFNKELRFFKFKARRNIFLNDLFSKEPWCHFPSRTRDMLLSAFGKVCNEPNKATEGFETRRTILYFYGKPGMGKTMAAEEFAKDFNLPYSEISATDLSEKGLTNNSPYEFDNKLGQFFKPLFIEDKKGDNWKNPVVFIDEFDKPFKLKPGDKLPEFILRFLNPDLKDLPCRYFGEGEKCEVSNIIVVLAGNSDFGLQDALDKKARGTYSEEEDLYKPLRDRLTMIPFEDFTDDARKKLLNHYIKKKGLLEHSTYFNNCDNDRNKVVKHIIDHYKDDSVRKNHEIIEFLVDTPEDKWKDLLIGKAKKEKKNKKENNFVPINDNVRRDKDKSLLWDKPHGIGNWGASCYFNAMAQLLFASKSFVAGICSEDAASCKPIKNFVTALKDDDLSYEKLKEASKPVIENFGFRCEVQSDPEEIGMTLLQFAKVPPVSLSKITWPFKNNKSFAGLKDKAESVNLISLDVGENDSNLKDLINAYSKINTSRDEKDQREIPKTGKSDFIQYRKLISQLQDDIFFVFVGPKDIKIKLLDNEIIDLTEIVTPEIRAEQEETHYRLKGILRQLNFEEGSRHHAYVRYGEQWWYCCDWYCNQTNYQNVKCHAILNAGSIILLERVSKNAFNTKLKSLLDFVRKNKVSMLKASEMGIGGLLPEGNFDKLAVASRREDGLSLFWIDKDGSLQEAYWYSSRENWGRTQIPITKKASPQGGIAALARDWINFDVFYIGHPEGEIRRATWNRNTRIWTDSGIGQNALTNSDLAATSRRANTMEILSQSPEGKLQNAHWYEHHQHEHRPEWTTYPMPDKEASKGGGLAFISRSPQCLDFWWVAPDETVRSAFLDFDQADKGWQPGETFKNVTATSRIAAFSDGSNNLQNRWLGTDNLVHGSSWKDGSPVKYLKNPEEITDLFENPILIPDFHKPASAIVCKDNRLLSYIMDADKNIRELASNEVIDPYQNTTQIAAVKDMLYKINDWGQIYRYDFDLKKWPEIKGDMDALKIALSPDGTLYKISAPGITPEHKPEYGVIMEFDKQSETWLPFEDINLRDAKDIAVDKNGDVYKLDNENSLYRYKIKSSTVELLSEFDILSLGSRGDFVTKKDKDGTVYMCRIDEL